LQTFSLNRISGGDDPILMILDPGLVVGVAYITEKTFLSLWIEKTEAWQLREGGRSIVEDRELFPLDSWNLIFSHPRIRQVLGQKIVKITFSKKKLPILRNQCILPKLSLFQNRLV